MPIKDLTLCRSRGPGVLLAVALSLFLPGRAQAETRSIAVVYNCASSVTQFEDGSEVVRDYRAHFVSFEIFDTEAAGRVQSLFSMGPQVAEAICGTFTSESPVMLVSGAGRGDVLGVAVDRDIEYRWLAIEQRGLAVDWGTPLYYVRPASEVTWGRTGLAITEFNCVQTLL